MSMFHQAAKYLNEDMYHEFKLTLVRGVWGSGEKLTEHQRNICEEVVSIYEAYKFEQPETTPMLHHNLFDNIYVVESDALH